MGMKYKSLRLSLIVALPLCALVVGVLVLRSEFGVALAKEPALSAAAVWPPIHTNVSNTSTKFSRGTGFDSNGSDIVAVWAEGLTPEDTYNGVVRTAWTGKTRSGWTREIVYNDSGFVGLSPSVAVVGTTAHFCWVAKVSGAEQYKVMYRTLDLTTGQFSLFEDVYPASGWTNSPESLGAIRIAVDSSGVAHLIWVRTYAVDPAVPAVLRDRIYYSNRSGGNWSAATRISGFFLASDVNVDSTDYSEDMPALVARGLDIYASWREKSAGDTTWGLYVRHRDPDGVVPHERDRWSLGAPSQPLGYRLSGGKYDEFPAMAAAGERLYVMWDRYLDQECDTLDNNCYQVYSMTYRVLTGDDIENNWLPSDQARNITIDDTPITALSSITTPLNPQTGQPNLLPPGGVPSPEGYFSGARPSLEVVSAGGVYTPYVVWHHWDNEGHRSGIVNPSEPYQIRGAYAEGSPGQESWEYLSDEQGGAILAMGADGTFASPGLALTTGTGDTYDVHVALNVRMGDEGSAWDVLYTNLNSYSWVSLPLVVKGYP
jgi:hypothetical protein